MFEKIKKLFSKEKKQAKRIAWNDSFELVGENGTYELKDFTGHISFGDRTECDVENATLTIVVGNAGYLDGTVEYHAPWSRGVNHILWHDGIVTNGNLHCHAFENGVFNGETLSVKGKMNGTFNGSLLHENVVF